jgi:hypothetical protein
MSKSLDQVRDHTRARNHSIRTEEAYVDWAWNFNLVRGKRLSGGMGEAEIQRFLTHPAVEHQATALPHNQRVRRPSA